MFRGITGRKVGQNFIGDAAREFLVLLSYETIEIGFDNQVFSADAATYGIELIGDSSY